MGIGITCALTKYAPPLAAFQIPLLGSAANLLGVFLGGLTAGICGAIVMYQIEEKLSGIMVNENNLAQLTKMEDILRLQNEQFKMYDELVLQSSSDSAAHITSDFIEARNKLEEIRDQKDEPLKSDNEEKFNDLSNLIGDLD